MVRKPIKDLLHRQHDSGDSSDDEFCVSKIQKIETEIMELYRQQVGIEPLDYSYKLFTMDELIDKYAKNYLFWWKLVEEETTHGFIKDRMHEPRVWYIVSRRNIFLENTASKFKTQQDLYHRILKRAEEMSTREISS
jgi:hypothetical protein